MFGRKRDKRKKLLFEILKAGGAITIVFVAPGAAPYILKPFMEKNNLTNSQVKRSIKEMKEDGLISVKEDKNGEVTIKLRKEGKIKALKYQIDEMKIKKPKKWDKKWRVVIFDIPEDKKSTRVIFKNKLDEFGFKLIQKSVYVCPYPCEDEIDFIAGVYGINRFVEIMRVDKIQKEERLKKFFSLD